MQRIAAVVVLLMVSIGSAWCSPPQSVTRYPALRYYSGGLYEAAKPHSLAEIPESIRLGLVAHLRTRLGNDFYRRLQFSGGQVVNIHELHRVYPDSINFRWEVPAYDLLFTFHMSEIGLDSYTAEIQLRANGSVLQELDLPDFADDPGKLHFTTLGEALLTAESKGFDPGKVAAQIAYDSKADALIWRLSAVSFFDGLVTKFENIDIYVDSGKVAKVYTTAAIH
jgi:hypothetical protein